MGDVVVLVNPKEFRSVVGQAKLTLRSNYSENLQAWRVEELASDVIYESEFISEEVYNSPLYNAMREE